MTDPGQPRLEPRVSPRGGAAEAWAGNGASAPGRDLNLLIPHGFEGNYVLGFARGLAANHVRFTVASDDEISARLAGAGLRQCNLRGSSDPARPGWRKAANLAQYYLRLLWTVFRDRPPTLHFIGQLDSRLILFEGLVLPVWFRLCARRYIHTAHNALPHGREDRRLFRALYRWVYRFPHTIVAHTAKVARQLEAEFGVDPARVVVVSIGLNEEIPPAGVSTEEARRQLGWPAHDPIALFFGKIEPYKGVDLLVEAAAAVRTPRARLMIAGFCPDAGYAQKVRSAIERSPAGAVVEWKEGFVPNERVAVWLQACDVVVMPYRHIYQSGVVFLCLRFGVPIVATSVGSLADYIDADSGIVTRTNDPAGIAEALDRFFANPARFCRDDISRRAARYSWDRQCALLKNLYD